MKLVLIIRLVLQHCIGFTKSLIITRLEICWMSSLLLSLFRENPIHSSDTSFSFSTADCNNIVIFFVCFIVSGKFYTLVWTPTLITALWSLKTIYIDLPYKMHTLTLNFCSLNLKAYNLFNVPVSSDMLTHTVVLHDCIFISCMMHHRGHFPEHCTYWPGWACFEGMF
jgi:hypothetical protein